MEKHWKKVKGYEGLYEVSNYGEVKSLNYRCTGKEKILKFSKDKGGYLFVHLCKNGVRKSFRVNRLVYMTFVGDIPKGLEVNHIDEDKHNNCIWNLNLMTSKENSNWGTGIARMAAARSKAVQALDKITGAVVMEFPSAAEAQRHGFSQGHISACCKGERKIHKGFIWRFRLPQ